MTAYNLTLPKAAITVWSSIPWNQIIVTVKDVLGQNRDVFLVHIVRWERLRTTSLICKRACHLLQVWFVVEKCIAKDGLRVVGQIPSALIDGCPQVHHPCTRRNLDLHQYSLDKNIQGIDPERDSSITRDADGRIALVMTSAFLIKETTIILHAGHSR